MSSTLDLSDEQLAFREAIRDFARRECGTREQRDRLTDGGEEVHSAEIYAKLSELGWNAGLTVPDRYGGGGGSTVDMCLLMQEAMRGLLPIRGIATTLIVAGPYERFAGEEQKREVLGGIVRGAVESVAISEPEAGSDAGAISCRAVREGDGWVVNGQKTWCSHANYADHILLVARTDAGADKHHGLTMLNVPAGTAGLEIRPIPTLGGREVNDLFFTDCCLPADAVVGEVDRAWPQLMAGLNRERVVLAATLLGVAERAFEDLLDYVKQRRQFGRPIGSFQVLRHRIADLATELECVRLLTYDVARRVDAERGDRRDASMAKLKATELAKRVTLEGMQMMGGYGYSTEYEMEHLVRFSLASTIYGGSSEIQREIIGKTLGL